MPMPWWYGLGKARKKVIASPMLSDWAKFRTSRKKAMASRWRGVVHTTWPRRWILATLAANGSGTVPAGSR